MSTRDAKKDREYIERANDKKKVQLGDEEY